MVTLKLNKSAAAPAFDKRRDESAPRGPVRGAGSAPRQRPTLAQAQDQRTEREARYQEQLRQRFGNSAPPAFNRGAAPEPRNEPRADRQRAPQRDAWPAHQQNRGAPPRQARQDDARDPRDQAPRNTAFDPRRLNQPQHQNQQQQPEQRPPQRPQQPPTDFRDRNARDDRGPDQAQAWRDAPPRQGRDSAPQRRGPTAAPDARHQRAEPPPRFNDRDHRDEQMAVEVPGSMRLSKRMSELGISSRREADEWIPKGWVRVDGRVVSELGSRVLPSQQITVDAKAKFVQAQKVTVILNKPIGYVSGQAEDGYEPAVVLIKPANQWREDQSGTRYLLTHLRGIAPAGRLDIDSIGLLVLTQDGRVAKQLIGEDSEMEKEYLVRVESPAGGGLSDSDLALLNHGLELDGEPLREALVEWINDDQLRFVLKEGKKRQIRRMCEAVGLKVVGLKRVRIGRVMLGDLPVGQWRYLRGDESFVALKPPTAG